ncbi:MAG: 3-phosphoserine/phosphohydroxythreonine transaminase, partial [Steroidobacteraceae bacterium]
MRVFNFSAGPAVLPLPVLEQARDELTDWQGGASIMEVSHRSRAFSRVAGQAEADLRELLAVPRDYRVLFMQGGATAQFAAVPMNLAAPGDAADYVNTGHWSERAIKEARRFVRVTVAADEAASGYTTVPDAASLRPTPGAAYLHYAPNETIGGVEFPYAPETGEVPLVADMSSTILSRPLDVSRFGLIYAGAQKNIGPAGLTVVIVRESLIGRARPSTPMVFDYRAVAEAGSMLNTPPTFAWYVAGLVFQWLKREGGLAAMAERNRAKAGMLYAAIDASEFYANPVAKHCRSRMNVPFRLARPELDEIFLAEAEAAGLSNLAG